VLRAPAQPLDAATTAAMEPRFGHDFSRVRVHTGARAEESARAVGALAYTVGQNVVFGAGQFAPGTADGRRLLTHELAHTIQQGEVETGTSLAVDNPASADEASADAAADAVLAGQQPSVMSHRGPVLQCRAAPFIKKVTVHLAPKQSADLEWQGTPPESAPGSDHFTVSTGKGYSDPGDPRGTCTRDCCDDPMTQCAPPWNKPGRVGACCTYFGDTFWTGTPQEEHNGWSWWTPIQPYNSSRGIALHQHTEVTGEPIGHGCVRMDEPNAHRIYLYSNGRQTNVTIDGRAAPVACADDRRCAASGGGRTEVESGAGDTRLATSQEPVPGLEGELT
jgi:hypothetical protein